MGLTDEFKKARDFVETLSFNVNYDASTFETTIRSLFDFFCLPLSSFSPASLAIPLHGLSSLSYASLFTSFRLNFHPPLLIPFSSLS